VCPPQMRAQSSHRPHGSPSAVRRGQLSAMARIRASVVFPTPRGPQKRYAWPTGPLRRRAWASPKRAPASSPPRSGGAGTSWPGRGRTKTPSVEGWKSARARRRAEGTAATRNAPRIPPAQGAPGAPRRRSRHLPLLPAGSWRGSWASVPRTWGARKATRTPESASTLAARPAGRAQRLPGRQASATCSISCEPPLSRTATASKR